MPSTPALENIGLDWVEATKQVPLTPAVKNPAAGTPTFQLVRGKNGSLTTAMVTGAQVQYFNFDMISDNFSRIPIRTVWV